MLMRIVTGLALMVLSGLYWLQADAIPQSPMSGSVGADGLPKLLALVLCGLSLIFVVQSILVRQPLAAPGIPEDDQDEDDAAFTRRGHVLAAALLAITIVYAVILPYAGYTVAMGFLLLAVGVFYNHRMSAGIAIFAILGAVVFHLIFITLLGVRMPEGIWPDVLAFLHAHAA